MEISSGAITIDILSPGSSTGRNNNQKLSNIITHVICRYIYNFLIEVALTNAFILFRPGHPKVHIKTFQQVLSTQLVGSYNSRKSAGRVSYTTRPLQLQHFPMKPGRKRGRCVLCRERGKRSDTQWHCRECNVWLCHTGKPEDCFYIFHRRMST